MMSRIFAALVMCAALTACAIDPPHDLPRAPTLAKGEPPLTDRTAASGLPLTEAQVNTPLIRADLAIDIDPAAQAIASVATLVFHTNVGNAIVQFDLDPNLPISAIALDGVDLPRTAWTNPEGLVTVTLPAPAPAGSDFTLTVHYAGQPHVAINAPWDGGFVWAKTKDGKPWIATAVEGEGCDLFWPCYDNPLAEMREVTLHITVPAGLKAPSNGRLLGVDPLSDGRSRWNWRARNVSGYAIALTVGPYEQIEATHRSRFGNTIAMDYWYLPGEEAKAQRLFAEFGPTLDFMEANIGPYPFADEKLGVVETPHLGMEHQTINAYGNGYKPAPEGFDWLFAHEFAHEWFGNQMTNADWDDMWLHEGFATYMQPLYAQWRGGDIAYMAWLWKIRQQVANRFPIVTDTSRTEAQVGDTSIGPGNDIYYKGALTLHMLRGLIGDRAFFASIRRLVYGRPDPQPGNFTPRFGATREFEALVKQESGRDLGWFFDAYLRKAALPDLKEERAGNMLTLRWIVADNAPFPMPVDVQIGDRTVTLPMTNGGGSVAVPAGAHVLIDPASKLLRQSDDMDQYRDREAK